MTENNHYIFSLKNEFIKNDDCIVDLHRLKNGNLVTCSQDKEINIFSSIDYSLKYSWTGHLKSINSICELNDSRLVSCSDDKRISIWSYNAKKDIYSQEIIFSAHSSYINKVIALKNGNFASCSTDTLVIIWKSEMPYNKLLTLSGHKAEVTSIIELHDKKIVSTTNYKDNGNLKIWTIDYDKNRLIKVDTIPHVFCSCINCLVELKNGKIAVGGYQYIRIVNVNVLQIESCIFCHTCLTSAMCILENGDIISADEEGEINIIDKEYYKLIKRIKNSHDMMIFSLCLMDENTLSSSSKDGVIKIWKIK